MEISSSGRREVCGRAFKALSLPGQEVYDTYIRLVQCYVGEVHFVKKINALNGAMENIQKSDLYQA